MKSVSQNEETSLQWWGNDKFKCRYAYYRAKESQELEESGQDFLGFQIIDSSFLFTVCDGVGMSFHGELASSFLGERLMEWLVSVAHLHETENLEISLKEKLQEWTIAGTKIVDTYELPENTPWLLRDVLNEKRAHGSESMFICGKIDVLPGQNEARLFFITHGDSYIQFFEDKELSTCGLQGKRKTGNRWSTRKGMIGEPLQIVCKTIAIDEINRIIVHSDGLSPLIQYDEAEVEEAIQLAQCSPASDDISFLDISW
ncbi:hypothetical protein [Bacillus cereus group sp. BfR-BA-01380]|uniref:hypothetical protein n=1 Tax=Bacillus cereus group sp. BfR-BA-01380 TaxID=2920324 RepID=UPI0037C12460